ncbi:MAG: ABC transporter substrate-binding protein [Myxococcota bacterium]
MTLLRIGALFVLVLAVAGCSLANFDRTECSANSDCSAYGAGSMCGAEGYCVVDADGCTTNVQCRDEMGVGSVCGADGMCQLLELPERCRGVMSTPSRANLPERLLLDGPTNDYVIGNLMDRSVANHVARERAARLAIRQLNDAGGLEGRDFGILFCDIQESGMYDSLSRTEAAVEMAQFLVSQVGVPAIIGPAASSDTQAVFGSLQDTDLEALVISPSATSNTLRAIDNQMPTDANPGLLWRTAAPDSGQARLIVDDMRARNITMVALINETGAYGEGLQSEFTQLFEMGGGTVVSTMVFDNATQRDSAINAAASAMVEEVLFVGQTDDVIAFLNSVPSLPGLVDKGIFLTDTAGGATVLESVSDVSAFARVRGTRPAPISGPEYDAFAAAYAAEYQGEDVRQFTFTSNAYDAAWMVGYGASWSAFRSEGRVTPIGIGQGMRRLSSGQSVEIRGTSWDIVKAAFRSEMSVDIQGTSGDLDYDPMTEETVGDIEVFTVIPMCPMGVEFAVVNVGDPAPVVMCN